MGVIYFCDGYRQVVEGVKGVRFVAGRRRGSGCVEMTDVSGASATVIRSVRFADPVLAVYRLLDLHARGRARVLGADGAEVLTIPGFDWFEPIEGEDVWEVRNGHPRYRDQPEYAPIGFIRRTAPIVSMHQEPWVEDELTRLSPG